MTRYLGVATDDMTGALLREQLASQDIESSGAARVGYDGETVEQALDKAKAFPSYTELRQYQGMAEVIHITNPGIEGFFIEVGAITPVDNGGTRIVDAAGRAWDRITQVFLTPEMFGAVGDGVADDFQSISTMISVCRATGLEGRFAAKVYKVSGSLDISGVQLKGVLSGFNNQRGTRLVGIGTNKMFVQTMTGAAYITYSLANFSISNCDTALAMSYAVHCSISHIYVTDCVNGVQCGQPGILGPLWCVFTSVRVRVSGDALVIQGTDFANANVFQSSFFYSTGTRVGFIGTTGGIGAVANSFPDTEIAGLGRGLELNRTKGTDFSQAYFECEAPAIHVTGQTLDLSIPHGKYGTLKNTNSTGIPAFIWHEAGTCTLSIEGGWVFLNAGAEYNNLFLLYSSLPASLTLKMMDPPTQEIASTGFQLFGPGLPTARFIVSFRSVSFTPVLTAATTPADIGNGTLTGSYSLAGRICSYSWTLTFGSTTSFGTGAIQISCPFAERSSTPDRAIGTVRLFDSGTTTRIGIAEIMSGQTQIVMYSDNTPNNVQSNSPFTWAVGDTIRGTITYEIE